jgi:hypothetical protein
MEPTYQALHASYYNFLPPCGLSIPHLNSHFQPRILIPLSKFGGGLECKFLAVNQNEHSFVEFVVPGEVGEDAGLASPSRQPN